MPTPTGLIRAKQTERLVAALIPPTTASTGAVPDAAATVLPLPTLAAGQPARFVHRTALLDDHGRVREATLFALLGWKPQQAVEVVEHGPRLLVRATPDGPVVLDRKRAEAHEVLRRFVSLGRAVGCSAVLATQRPTSDTVDTGTRALLAHRLALRCGDRWQSEAILGQGSDQAARIPLSSPGLGC